MCIRDSTSIDTGLYEAASIDGANRFKQMIHITLPGILPIVLLMSAINVSNILNAGFDQIFNLYNPVVYETGDIIDTYVYRAGLLDMQFSFCLLYTSIRVQREGDKYAHIQTKSRNHSFINAYDFCSLLKLMTLPFY